MIEYGNQSDDTLIRLAQAGDRDAMEEMTLRHDALVKYVAKRYIGRGCDFDDLHQLGRVGLIKAIKNFNAAYTVKFSTYAVPVIMGEIRRFLRDDGQVHVTRTIRENAAKIRRLISEGGEALSVGDIALRLNMDEETVMLALNSERQVRSLNEPVTEDGTTSLGDTLGMDDSEAIVNRLEITHLLSTLPARERAIIERRYFLEQTQTRIAHDLGMSQVQVSRMETRILKRLREIAG